MGEGLVFFHGLRASMSPAGRFQSACQGLGPRLRGERGCGGIKSPYDPSGHFPQRGKIQRSKIFPLWGKYRRSRGRGLLVPPSNPFAAGIGPALIAALAFDDPMQARGLAKARRPERNALLGQIGNHVGRHKLGLGRIDLAA
ncbi:MAG: hypothetical protein RIT46_388 [Pseudomonadota bacterium]